MKLNSEDQLLKFINFLYRSDRKYSILYELVYFLNVSSSEMNEFVSIFDANDITIETWKKLCERMKEEIKIESKNNSRYNNDTNQKGKLFKYSENVSFSGIINYLNNQSNNNIKNEINFTSSPIYEKDMKNFPINITSFNDDNVRFVSTDEKNSWLTLEFKNYKVIPTDYTIKTSNSYVGSNHLKSWVIEGSNDNQTFEILDEKNDCSLLNGQNVIHTFSVNNQKSKEFRYIKIRLTGPNWDNRNYLTVGSFELYGRLI